MREPEAVGSRRDVVSRDGPGRRRRPTRNGYVDLSGRGRTQVPEGTIEPGLSRQCVGDAAPTARIAGVGIRREPPDHLTARVQDLEDDLVLAENAGSLPSA